MSDSVISGSTKTGLIKNLKKTQAYAQYKMMSAGDLDSDLVNWTNNLAYTIINEKSRKTKIANRNSSR